MRSIEERYNFLVSRLTVEHPDYWEGDAVLSMKSFCFGFSTDPQDDLNDIGTVIDLAIESADQDAKYKEFCKIIDLYLESVERDAQRESQTS